MSLIILHTGWPKIRYTIFWLFCIWSLKSISLKYLMPFIALTIENEVHFNTELFLITQLFVKLHDLKYLSRFFSCTWFLIFKRCQSRFFVWKLHQIKEYFLILALHICICKRKIPKSTWKVNWRKEDDQGKYVRSIGGRRMTKANTSVTKIWLRENFCVLNLAESRSQWPEFSYEKKSVLFILTHDVCSQPNSGHSHIWS